jgi:hypothetical protein
MTTFKHSGATGDIIFSLPTIKKMGGGTLYISPYNLQRAESIAPLIKLQDYIDDVIIADNMPLVDVDLDKFRVYAGHHSNLIEAHLKAQGLEDNSWRDGWLRIEDKNPIIDYTYSVINTGANYKDPNFDWGKEIKYLLTLSDRVFYLGYRGEFDLLNTTEAEFFECDFLTAAEMIYHARMFTGGYSALSTIAMGLGINYRMVQAPDHTCSSLLMEREKIINI